MSSAQNKSPILLFIGSFLSLQSGSLCVSEKLSGKLREYGLQVELISRKRNKLNRIIDIITSLLFSEANLVHIDVYSGQAFMITEIATFICKMLGKKMILTLHGGALLVFYPNNKKRIHRAFNRAAIITTPSQILQQFFE